MALAALLWFPVKPTCVFDKTVNAFPTALPVYRPAAAFARNHVSDSGGKIRSATSVSQFFQRVQRFRRG